ncbi:MAG: leucine-rich repeat protein, partial [Clostridia bacterium]|nr:leucine-rich repeat protein [Clostridia bacterium]
KLKSKLIASIMSVCLVCAVFAIGVFALKTANLKIGGDVSFNATGVEAHIKNASVSGAVTPTTLAANDAEGEVINTSMTQADIDTTFATWSDIKLDFDAEATDIELKFEIANTSTNTNNYIEIDYDYSFTTANPNVDVFPGDENGEGEWVNNKYILSPKGSAETAAYETFTLKFKVLNKELNVPQDTNVSVNIELKHVVPESLTLSEDSYTGIYLSTMYYKGDLNYIVVGDQTPATAAVAGYNNQPTNLTIPSVVAIGENHYFVSRILGDAFVKSETPLGTLETVTFPNTITEIDQMAFAGTSLKSVIIPKSLSLLTQCLFDGCKSLTSISLPNSVTEFENGVFYDCAALESIRLPNSLTSMHSYNFQGCEKLKSIYIPEALVSIGYELFSRCGALQSVVVAEGNPVYDSRDNCNAIIETETNLLLCGSNVTVIVESIETIRECAFSDCKGLTTIVIPRSCKTIEPGAFANCENLTSVEFKETSGWWYSDYSEKIGDIEGITQQASQANAKLLNETYLDYYWYRSV